MIINIVDRIGKHSGMDYYHQSFRDKLERIEGLSVRILSDYPDNGLPPFFANQYNGSRSHKLNVFLKNLKKLRRYVSSHRTEVFILENFGEIQDLMMMLACSKSNVNVMDVHEAIAQDKDETAFFRALMGRFYRKTSMTAIVHSERTVRLMDSLGFKNDSFFVPHFRYIFDKSFNPGNVGEDIKNAISPERINILFFGNLNFNKGIDILVKSVNMLPEAACNRLNFIVAGKNHDDSCFLEKNGREDILRLIIRHINDDELNYLFSHIQYISLPYRKTSQSGILEMALFFRKPILATNVGYFSALLQKYPSFGLTSDIDAESYRDLLTEIAGGSFSFFTDEDCSRYDNLDENAKFLSEFGEYLSKVA